MPLEVGEHPALIRKGKQQAVISKVRIHLLENKLTLKTDLAILAHV